MPPRFFDIHTHINDRQFDSDRNAVLSRMDEQGVWGIVVGTDRKTSQDAAVIASFTERGVFASIGVHPTDDRNARFEPVLFEELLKSGVVAVGECGLDYARMPEGEGAQSRERVRQKELFTAQIDFAVAHDLPLIIHCRDSDKVLADAHGEVLAILREKKELYGARLRGDIHFFTQTETIAREYTALDFSISFTGVITFSREYDAVIRAVQLDCLIAETDCPYVAPIPYRGTRNEPIFIEEVVRKIAEIRGDDYEMVRTALFVNACRLFGISTA